MKAKALAGERITPGHGLDPTGPTQAPRNPESLQRPRLRGNRRRGRRHASPPLSARQQLHLAEVAEQGAPHAHRHAKSGGDHTARAQRGGAPRQLMQFASPGRQNPVMEWPADPRDGCARPSSPPPRTAQPTRQFAVGKLSAQPLLPDQDAHALRWNGAHGSNRPVPQACRVPLLPLSAPCGYARPHRQPTAPTQFYAVPIAATFDTRRSAQTTAPALHRPAPPQR